MILDHNKLINSIETGAICIEPFDERQVQGASLDLRIGPQGASVNKGGIINIEEDGFMTLEPGDMAVLSTLEILTFDASHVGRIGLRSKYSRKGVHVTSGLQIDPGFSGRLFIGVNNLTPQKVTLPYRDDFISIEIHRLAEPTTKPYSGPYQHKVKLGPEDIEHIVDGKSYTLSEIMKRLQSLDNNIQQIKADHQSLDTKFGHLSSEVSLLASEMKFIKWAIPSGFAALAIMIAAATLILALK